MRKSILLLTLLTLGLITYAQNYTLLGEAVSLGGCNCYRLTQAVDNQAGAIFQNQSINLNNSFDFTFDVFLGCNNGNDAADGMAFVLTSNPNGLGSAGGGLGYGGGNQPFSIAIEFDTYQNSQDPSFDHIAIESGGGVNHNIAGPVPALTNSANIDNCQYYPVRIVWNVNTNTYQVYFNGVLRISVVIPNMVNTYFGGNPIVNWGWSAGTGGSNNEHRVCVLNTSSWVAGVNYQSCSPTMQFTDISTSSLGNIQSWAWNFGDGTTSNLQNPTHTYSGNGTYNVTLTITDLSGCTNTFTNPVVIAAPITLTPNLIQPPCNGGLNGTIGVTPSGGFGPSAGYGGYTYNWNGGQSTQQSFNGGAGTYAVTVTDGVCTTTAQYTLNQPSALTATTSVTNASCGLNNGSVTMVISGGTPPYTNQSWAGFPGATVNNLPAGTYIANFNDANGCSALLQYSATIGSLPCGVNSSVSQVNVSCFGGSNGSATLTVTGASGTPTINWSNGASGPTATNLSAGTYTYTFSDAVPAHTFSGSVVITQPGAAMVADLTTVNISCNGSSDGQAIASVLSGGASPYTYAWSGGQPNNAVASNLSAGNITVTITDGLGCTATATDLVTGPPNLSLTISTVNDSCFNGNLGSATANVSGGNPPYTFYWSNISSAQTNLGLGAGTYTVTVTDDKGCTTTGSTTINQPAAINYNATAQNVNCFGNSTGSITVNISGGTPGYTYTWSPNVLSGNNPSGLAAGTYFLTVADGLNCTNLDTFVITQPAAALSVTTSHTDVTCFGLSNGTVTVNIAGGTPPYSFQGNPVPPGTTTLTGLAANTYSGNVVDLLGCSVAVSETVTQPAAISATETHVNPLCNGTATGSIDVTVSGGTTPYTFAWNGGASTEDRTGLVAGVYSVTITDFNACSATLSVTLSEPTPLTATETHVNVLCNGADTGSIDVTVSGGTTPYSFAWNGGATSEDRTGLVAGAYTVTITDFNACATTLAVTISEPSPLMATETHVNVICNGAATGSIDVTVSGGTTPYTFAWNGGATSEDRTGLVAGAYSVTITDFNACTATLAVSISEPTILTATETHIDALCSGATNGSIDLSVSGGTAPYTYIWSNAASTQDLSNIATGTYSVTITDVNLCTATLSATVNEPPAPAMSVNVTNATCFGANGSATAIPGGGTAPFSYVWSSNTVNNATNSLPAGSYTVSATDVNGCNQTATFTINEPADLTIQVTQTNVSCFGQTNGDILLAVSNGVGPNYTYTWSPNVSTSNFAGLLGAGVYNITVTDQANCNKSISVTITEPTQPLTINVQSNNISCFGLNDGSINITTTGGTNPYNFVWSPNVSTTNSATNLSAASYNITVSDLNNCSLITNVTISEPNQPLNVTNTPTNLSCFQSNDGSIGLSTTGGSFPYQYSWSPNVSTTNSANSLSAGNYAITVTDNNGCTTSTAVSLTQPTPLTATETHVNVLCNGAATGAITINATGGTLGTGYTYSWVPNISTTNQATTLAAGVYSVTITDANNCTISLSSTIAEPTALQLNLTATGALCFGDGNGTITANTTGGVSPYNYTLTADGVNFTPSISGLFNNLTANTYTVEVIDNNNCTTSQTIAVTEPNAINMGLTPTNPTCFNYTNGEIITMASGGAGGYVFNSSTNTTNSTGIFTNLADGTYSITTTDQNGCSVMQTITLTEPDSVLIDVSPNPLEVKLGESLQLNTTTNQSGQLSYQWVPSFGLSCADCSNPIFEGVYSQPYQVFVTNANGCLGSSAVVVMVVPNYDLFFPNAFTPNGDGTNDFWQMFGNRNAMKQIEVTVFNRIGEKVFESKDLNFQWDGSYKGDASPNGVYVYVAKIVWLNNHSDSDYKGSITLFR